MTAAKTRKSLSSTVKKDIEDKNNIVNNIIKLKKELTWDSFVTQILKNI